MQSLTPTILALRSANVLLDIVGQILFGAMVITTVKQKSVNSQARQGDQTRAILSLFLFAFI
jgi:hypothetical protein